jgi:Tfp pilus assembly protein PilX
MYTQQTGSALAISLVLLTAITLISITSLQRSGLQTKIVANSQHSEAAFHAANNELEEMFEAYANDPNAAAALSETIDDYDIEDGEKKYIESNITGVNSSYQENAQTNPRHVQIASRTIIHTGQPIFSSGNSQGGFTTYRFEATTVANTPNGRTSSSQSSGIEFIGPALN